MKEDKGKSDSRIDMVRRTEVESGIEQDVKKFVESSSNSSSMEDSGEQNKFKKERIKNKKSEEKLTKINKVLEKIPDKDKARRTTVEQNDVNKSGENSGSTSESGKEEKREKMKAVSEKKKRDFKVSVESGKPSGKIKMRNLALKEKNGSIDGKKSKSVSESEKKEKKEKSKSKNGKTRKLSENLYASEKDRNKKKIKKHRNTSKSTDERCEIKKHKAKKLENEHIHKGNKDFIEKNDGDFSNKIIKLEGQTEKIQETDMKKSKSSNKISFDKKMKQADAILMSGSEKESNEAKGQGKLNSRRQPGTMLLEDRGKDDKPSDDIRVTRQPISTSAALSGNSLVSLASPLTPITFPIKTVLPR